MFEEFTRERRPPLFFLRESKVYITDCLSDSWVRICRISAIHILLQYAYAETALDKKAWVPFHKLLLPGLYFIITLIDRVNSEIQIDGINPQHGS